MQTDLAGKVVVVTGAAGGIGSAIARSFAAEGAHLVLHYRRNRCGADRLRRELSGTGAIAAWKGVGCGVPTKWIQPSRESEQSGIHAADSKIEFAQIADWLRTDERFAGCPPCPPPRTWWALLDSRLGLAVNLPRMLAGGAPGHDLIGAQFHGLEIVVPAAFR